MDKSVEDIKCSICLDEEEEEHYKLECNHTVHLSCVKNCIRTGCPLCRKKMGYLPHYVYKQIKKNSDNYDKAIEEENEQRARELAEVDEEEEINHARRCLDLMFIDESKQPDTIVLYMPEEKEIPPGMMFHIYTGLSIDRAFGI